jgi:hypothetical protein
MLRIMSVVPTTVAMWRIPSFARDVMDVLKPKAAMAINKPQVDTSPAMDFAGV